MDRAAFTAFIDTVWTYYAEHGRDLPWRQPEADGSFDPYKIMVSEIMLQQTQVNRVMPKYHDFLARFPDVDSLAAAPQSDVLIAWSGLGYNRRARFLHQAARQVAGLSAFPCTKAELVVLPGIGPNTAGAILAYAFNLPELFIETNVRSVYIHHFFADETAVSDKAILQLLESTVDRDEPRQWYWALMDYGSHLKQTSGNAARQSKAYVRQSTFAGSRRQIRGTVLRLLTDGPIDREVIVQTIPDERLVSVLNDLIAEGFIVEQQGRYRLAA